MIKKTFATYRVKKALNQKRIALPPIKLYQAKRIGIIWHISQSSSIAYFEELLRKYCSQGVEIRSWICVEKKSDIKKAQEAVPVLSAMDLNLLGRIQKRSTQKLIRGDYDFIFCLSYAMPLVIQIILANCNAKMRVGLYHEKNQMFLDFMYKPTSDEHLNKSLGNMITYLEKLN